MSRGHRYLITLMQVHIGHTAGLLLLLINGDKQEGVKWQLERGSCKVTHKWQLRLLFESEVEAARSTTRNSLL